MTKKELSEYIVDQGVSIRSVMELTGFYHTYFYHHPDDEVPSVHLQIILSAIGFRRAQMIEELTFKQSVLEKMYESKVRRSLDAYADRIAAYAEKFRSLNEDELSLDNLVDDSWKQKLTTTD